MTKSSDLSNNERLVMDVLGRETGPVSAYMILDKLRGSGFRAPLQVYRALDKLIGMGKRHKSKSEKNTCFFQRKNCRLCKTITKIGL